MPKRRESNSERKKTVALIQRVLQPASSEQRWQACRSYILVAFSKRLISECTASKGLIPKLTLSGALGVNEVLAREVVGRFMAPVTDFSVDVLPNCGRWRFGMDMFNVSKEDVCIKI